MQILVHDVLSVITINFSLKFNVNFIKPIFHKVENVIVILMLVKSEEFFFICEPGRRTNASVEKKGKWMPKVDGLLVLKEI